MADENLPLRVAVLEQIARNTDTTLTDIRAEVRDIRSDLRDIRQAQRTDFRWLLGIILAVLLAQAALWQRVGSFEAQMTAIGTQVNGIAADVVRLLPRQGG